MPTENNMETYIAHIDTTKLQHIKNTSEIEYNHILNHAETSLDSKKDVELSDNETEDIVINTEEVEKKDKLILNSNCSHHLKNNWDYYQSFLDYILDNNTNTESCMNINTELYNETDLNKTNLLSIDGIFSESHTEKYLTKYERLQDKLEADNSSQSFNENNYLLDIGKEEYVDIENYIKCSFIESDAISTISTSNEIPFHIEHHKNVKDNMDTMKSGYEFFELNQNTKTNDIHDIISISSEDTIDRIEIDISHDIELHQNKNDSDSDGYHSSDFEFIDEKDAADDEFIMNVSLSQLTDKECYQKLDSEEICNQIDPDLIIYDYFNTPGSSKENQSENYVIPSGDDYNNLFQGNFLSYPLLGVENKAICPLATMHVQHEGIGFDMRVSEDLVNEDKSLRTEAQRTAQIIRSLDPNKRIGRRTKRHQ